MPANSGLPDNSQRFPVVCECGKKLVSKSTQSGKRLKCPSCGQFVIAPPEQAGIVQIPTKAASEPRLQASGQWSTIVQWSLLCSLPVIFVAGAAAYIHFDTQSRHQARIDVANAEVREAIKSADAWLEQGRENDAENVEHRLSHAMVANDVSDKANADAVLEHVRTRRAELAADSIFDSAKTKLDAKSIDEAFALLNRYLADDHATKKSEAEQLFAQYELATSESAAIDTLVAMSDEQFVQFRNTGKLDDGEIGHPILEEIRAATLRQNVAAANLLREEKKVAEASRQKSEQPVAAAPIDSAPPSGAPQSDVPPNGATPAHAGTPGAPNLFGEKRPVTMDLPIQNLVFANDPRRKALRAIPPAPPNTPAGSGDGFVPLFNGRDLTGWKMHDIQPGHWQVENGLLIATKPGHLPGRVIVTGDTYETSSFLYTERDDFTDFHLRVVAWVNEGTDSGVSFRNQFGGSTFPDLLPLGYEADIHDGDAGSLLTVSPKDDRVGVTVLSRGKPELPKGEWVTLEVIAAKNYIIIKVNGATVVDFRDDQRRYSRGHIALQCRQREAKVGFHKIEINELAGADLLAFTESRDQRAVEELDQYLKQQIQDLELGRRLVNLSKQDIQRRERAIDNLKALGPAAIPAVPALAWAAVNVPQTFIARKAIELLGEIGGHQGIAPICQSLHRSLADPSEIDRVDINRVVREVLIKLLPTVGRSLTMDDAIPLWDMLHSFSRLDERLYPATVSAWEASGIEPAAVAKEIARRARAKDDSLKYNIVKGMGHLKQPPLSAMNWRLLTECELVQSANGVVNLRRKSEEKLWGEYHPREARLASEDQKRKDRADMERRAALDALPGKTPGMFKESASEAESRRQQEFNDNRARINNGRR